MFHCVSSYVNFCRDVEVSYISFCREVEVFCVNFFFLEVEVSCINFPGSRGVMCQVYPGSSLVSAYKKKKKFYSTVSYVFKIQWKCN